MTYITSKMQGILAYFTINFYLTAHRQNIIENYNSEQIFHISV